MAPAELPRMAARPLTSFVNPWLSTQEAALCQEPSEGSQNQAIGDRDVPTPLPVPPSSLRLTGDTGSTNRLEHAHLRAVSAGRPVKVGERYSSQQSVRPMVGSHER
jgi:hypothetical protein